MPVDALQEKVWSKYYLEFFIFSPIFNNSRISMFCNSDKIEENHYVFTGHPP